MADYTNSKGLPGGGKVYPENAVASPWPRCEPLLTPEQLRTRYLFGIPLVSRIKNPITNAPDVITDEILKDYINQAVNTIEAEAGIDIMPTQYEEKLPFDRSEFVQYGYLKVNHKPVASVQSLNVVPPTGAQLFQVPLDWIETAYMVKGQINIIPLTPGATYGGLTSGSGQVNGSIFLNIMGNSYWVPAYWAIKYTTGFPDGQIPVPMNQLIGIVAAQRVLSQLAATYSRSTSTSLGIDGMSQSIATPGPNLFQVRMSELEQEKQKLFQRFRKIFGQKLFIGNI